MLYSPRYPVYIIFQGAAAKLSYFFSCVVCLALAPFWLFDVHILKQLFAEGEANIGEYLLCLRFGKYSPIFTLPPAR